MAAANKEIKGFYSRNFKLHGEVRKTEEKSNSFTSKDGKNVETSWLEIHALDDDEDSMLVFIDKNISHKDMYKRGMIGTFQLRIDFDPKFATGKYDASMSVIGFEQD